MTPIPFPEQTGTLQRPAGMSEAGCGALPVYQDGQYCISLWKPSFWERLSLLFRGKCWLMVWSGLTQPPVWVGTAYPFEPKKPGVET